MLLDDEERFAKLCETIEDAIREIDGGEGKYLDFEVMQALDFIGFNFFRDDWEEFKKVESPREFSLREFNKTGGKYSSASRIWYFRPRAGT